MFGFTRPARRVRNNSVAAIGLESRVLPAIQVQQFGGVVSVNGTSASEAITITRIADASGVMRYQFTSANSEKFSLNGGPEMASVGFAQDRLSSLNVDLGAGADALKLNAVVASFLKVSDSQGLAGTDSTYVAVVGGEYSAVAINIEGGSFLLNLSPAPKLTPNQAETAQPFQVFGDLKVALKNTSSSTINISTEYVSQGNVLGTNSFLKGSLTVDSSLAPDSIDVININTGKTGRLTFGAINLNLGNKDDIVSISGGVTVSGATTINTGTGNDLLTMQFIGNASESKFTGPVQVRMGDGDDRFLTDGTNIGSSSNHFMQFEGAAVIDVGAGSDQVSMIATTFGKSLGIVLGSGDNFLEWKSLTTKEVVKATTTESGSATVVISGSSRFMKAVNLQLGDGSVNLSVGTFGDVFSSTLTVKGLRKRPVVRLNQSNPNKGKLVLVKADLG